MEDQILVYYFIRNFEIDKISELTRVNQWEIKEIINKSLKTSISERFIILESKMNIPDE